MFWMLIAAVATQPQPAVEPPPADKQECRRFPSSNGAFIGRKVCAPTARWAAYDDAHRRLAGDFAQLSRPVGDADNRTMARAPLVTGGVR